jgi:hypothetical protein
MTTPENPPSGANSSDTSGVRPTIVPPAEPGSNPGAGAKAAETPPGQSTIDEDVSRAVQRGYAVITETLQQGRMAAERFRQGSYNIPQASADIGQASSRMLELASALSQTTFYLGERLWRELATASQEGRDTGGPPPPSPVVPYGQMKLNVSFDGDAAAVSKAKGRTDAIDRPEQGGLKQIHVTPLAPIAGGDPITEVTYEANLATGGLNAKVILPSGVKPGLYHGVFFADGQTNPLGPLTIEILA